jgi:hypothetical protein
MSEKRSWDIAPRRNGNTSRPVPKPAADVVLVGRVQPRGSKESLRKRRSRSRRRGILITLVFLILLAGGLIYLFKQPFVRIQNIGETGYSSQAVADAARAAMGGVIYGIIPRDSVFFFSKADIMAAVLQADSNIAAVSVTRSGLTGITLAIIPRAQSYVWCGASVATAAGMPCFRADADGTLFTQFSPPDVQVVSASSTASSTSKISNQEQMAQAAGQLVVYAPLASTSDAVQGSKIANASVIPAALRFARALNTLGGQSISLQIRGDEIDIFMASGTRITYVAGNEQAAINAAAASFPQLNLKDGSVNYVDLRFGGKAYVKKAGA